MCTYLHMCSCKFYTISAQKLLKRVQLYLNPLLDYPQFSQKHPAPCFTIEDKELFMALKGKGS